MCQSNGTIKGQRGNGDDVAFIDANQVTIWKEQAIHAQWEE